MIQDQLVDYINAQTKLGVSRDTIKNTLVSAGWVAADVEDTLKKVESQNGASPMATASAATAAPMGISTGASSPSAKPASVGGSSASASSASSGPQILKVSDLVSGSSAAPSVTPPAMASSTVKDISLRSPLTGPTAKTTPASAPATTPTTFTATSMEYPPKSHTSRAAIIVDAVLVLLLLGVGGLAGFLYMQNHTLSGQLTTLQGQNSGTNSQVSSLQSQLAASTTALAAQISSISSKDQELQNELSFYAAPSSTTPATTTSVTVNGILSGGGKSLYMITAVYGAKISIINSKDANVVTALTPLVGTTTSQQFGGTYVPGSDELMLTVVNGTAIQ